MFHVKHRMILSGDLMNIQNLIFKDEKRVKFLKNVSRETLYL